MPKRLLIIIDEMEVGGSQRNIVDMARNIDTSVFSISLVYFRKSSPYVEELQRIGVDVKHIPKRGRLDFAFLVKLCRFVRSNDFDVIHAFSFSGELWGWLANMLVGNARFVSTIHSVYEWYSPIQWVLKRWIMLGSTAVVANSQAGADHAAFKSGVRRNRIDVVRNGVMLPDVADDSGTRRLLLDGNPLRLLFVGRLVSHKNIECMLRAFEIVVNRDSTILLDIVGDGPLRAGLEQRAGELGISESVFFHGEKYDIAPFLFQSHVFVITSLREGLSNAVMEAMGTGLPVIASNVGGNPELIVHDRSGMLFPSDDHETLAEMILELRNDSGKRLRLAEGAQAAARRFNDPGRMASEMERIYERCLVDSCAYVVRR